MRSSLILGRHLRTCTSTERAHDSIGPECTTAQVQLPSLQQGACVSHTRWRPHRRPAQRGCPFLRLAGLLRRPQRLVHHTSGASGLGRPPAPGKTASWRILVNAEGAFKTSVQLAKCQFCDLYIPGKSTHLCETPSTFNQSVATLAHRARGPAQALLPWVVCWSSVC